MQKHETSSTEGASTSSSKKCPLCVKPRILHRNQQITKDGKVANFRQLVIFECNVLKYGY